MQPKINLIENSFTEIYSTKINSSMYVPIVLQEHQRVGVMILLTGAQFKARWTTGPVRP